jgi:hypothetical protein
MLHIGSKASRRSKHPDLAAISAFCHLYATCSHERSPRHVIHRRSTLTVGISFTFFPYIVSFRGGSQQQLVYTICAC